AADAGAPPSRAGRRHAGSTAFGRRAAVQRADAALRTVLLQASGRRCAAVVLPVLRRGAAAARHYDGRGRFRPRVWRANAVADPRADALHLPAIPMADRLWRTVRPPTPPAR